MTLADGAAGRTARPGRQYAEVAYPPLFQTHITELPIAARLKAPSVMLR
jgi:hypothetical protein